MVPRRVAVSAPVIREIIRRNREPDIQTAALISLGLLNRARQDAEDTAVFTERLGAADLPVRAAAAIALGETLGADLPSMVVTVLIEAVAMDVDVREERLKPWSANNLVDYAIMLLGAVGHRERERIVPALCEGFTEGFTGGQVIAGVILILAFRSGERAPIQVPGDAAALSPLQWMALDQLADWQSDYVYCWPGQELLHHYGLPDSPEALRAFLDA